LLCSLVSPHYKRADDDAERIKSELENDDEAVAIMEGSSAEEVMAAMLQEVNSIEILKRDDIWIGDTGATQHSTFSRLGAVNDRESRSASIGHSGEAVTAQRTIDLPGMFVAKDGSSGIEATLCDVNYHSGYNFNLLSLSKLLQNGWEITRGDSAGIIVKKGNCEVAFDILIPTRRSVIFACRFVRYQDSASVSLTGIGAKMSIGRAHGLLGHGSEESTRQTAKELGWTITRGRMSPCEHCAVAKAKQKDVCKDSKSPKAEKPGGRVYLDLSKVTVSRADNSKFEIKNKWWCIVVDECTGKKWSMFYSSKDAMIEPTAEFFNLLKTRGIPISKVRLDPAGENLKLEKRCKSSDWQALQPIDFEVTSRETPQHNSLAELAFPYLAGMARAVMNAANIPDDEKGKVVIQALMHVTQLDGLKVVEIDGKTATRNEHVYGSNPKWANNLRTFGEAGVVKEGKDGKSGDRGTTMMFVGYPANRESDSKRMWNAETNRVVVTRDVLWLKRYFYQQKEQLQLDTAFDDSEEIRTDDAAEDDDTAEDDDNVSGQGGGEAVGESSVDTVESGAGESDTYSSAPNTDGIERRVRFVDELETTTTRSGRVVIPRSRWIEELDAIALKYLNDMQALDNIEVANAAITSCDNIELSLVGAGVGGGFTNTSELKVMNYNEAMASNDAKDWIAEVGREKGRFDKYNALTAIKRSDVPEGAKILTSTWAMKKKSNGTFRGRLNVRGFQQTDGVHYYAQNIAAPVTNPSSVRIALTLFAMNPDWIAMVIDVEGAFLQGKFTDGEEIYIEVPQGFEKYYPEGTVLRCNVPIYGTKQAAACFYNKLVKELKDRNYKRSKADPCLYFVWIENRLALFISWVDDILAMGYRQDVEQIKADLENAFDCKSEGELKEYVGNKITIEKNSDGTKRLKFTQPVLLKKIEDEFGDDLPNGKASTTPATAGQVLVRGDGSGVVDSLEATRYRSGVATLMYMAQWSRPEIQNAVRSLARQMQEPRIAHVSALYRLMKYMLATPARGLVLNPDGVWDGSKNFVFVIHGRSDSDYASNTDDRRSISGCRAFLNGSPITFRSATQKTVTLSVTEAEGAAGVSTAQDMLYAYNVLHSLGLKVELPMILEMDNKGAVDLANNWSVGGRTRHVDVRNHFLRELKDRSLIVIRHISGDDNDADIFTKNTSAAVFERHIPLYVGIDEYMSGDTPDPEQGRVLDGVTQDTGVT